MKESIAVKLREERERSGLQAKAVAERAGLDQSVLSRYETGRQEPSIRALEKILDVYGITLSEFFSDNYQEEKQNKQDMTEFIKEAAKLAAKVMILSSGVLSE